MQGRLLKAFYELSTTAFKNKPSNIPGSDRYLAFELVSRDGRHRPTLFAHMCDAIGRNGPCPAEQQFHRYQQSAAGRLDLQPPYIGTVLEATRDAWVRPYEASDAPFDVEIGIITSITMDTLSCELACAGAHDDCTIHIHRLRCHDHLIDENDDLDTMFVDGVESVVVIDGDVNDDDDGGARTSAPAPPIDDLLLFMQGRAPIESEEQSDSLETLLERILEEAGLLSQRLRILINI